MDEQTQPKSFVFAVFSDIGNVNVNVKFENVTPLQVLALAAYLELKGKSALMEEENQRLERERQMNIARPSQEITIARK